MTASVTMAGLALLAVAIPPYQPRIFWCALSQVAPMLPASGFDPQPYQHGKDGLHAVGTALP